MEDSSLPPPNTRAGIAERHRQLTAALQESMQHAGVLGRLIEQQRGAIQGLAELLESWPADPSELPAEAPTD